MCLQKKFYYKIIFWTCVCTLLVIIILSGFGLYDALRLKQKYERYESLLEKQYEVMMSIIMICTFLMLIVSTAALIGVVMDWYPLLILTSYALIITSFISTLVGFWVLFVSRDGVGPNGMTYGIVDKLEALLRKPDFLTYNAAVLDPINTDYACCGIYSYRDYSTSSKRQWMRDLLPLPSSCCYDTARNCKPGTDEHKKNGCMTKYTLAVTESYLIFAVFLVVGGISTGINGLYANLLAKKAKEVYLYYPYYF